MIPECPLESEDERLIIKVGRGKIQPHNFSPYSLIRDRNDADGGSSILRGVGVRRHLGGGGGGAGST